MRISGPALLTAIALFYLGGCEGRLAPPEIRDQQDPSGIIHEQQEATARIVKHQWEDVEVYIRYSLIPGELPLHAQYGEPLCHEDEQRGDELVCTYAFPGAHALQPGQEMFYQWFVDYRRPQATDASTVEGERRSFIMRPAVSGNEEDIEYAGCLTSTIEVT